MELDDAAPGAQAAGGTLTCDVTSIQLQGTGNGSFDWTGPGGFTSSDQNPTVSVAGTYDLTVTGANGCQSFASAEVELDDAAPGAQAAGGTLTCDVTSIQLQGTGTISSTGPAPVASPAAIRTPRSRSLAPITSPSPVTMVARASLPLRWNSMTLPTARKPLAARSPAM
ncbi:MAG: hypothetical protein IPM46_06505 [Flavobacteriales bacterium]|nr:hypothetical protein [Flavobacteriales bacterium]